MRVAVDDRTRDPDELCVRPVVEEEVFAQVLVITAAVEALVARGRVRGHNPVTDFERRDRRAHLRDVACELVAERSWERDHAGMVSAAEDLQVRAARERGPDSDQYVCRPDGRNADALHAQVLLAVQHAGQHVPPANHFTPAVAQAA